MIFLLTKLVFLLLPVNILVGMNLEGMRFIYQEDMSEHCRRRVIPSVFLGSHVMNADAKMMHFSKLEAPYSCVIGVRTESGSHIILVVQLQNKSELKQSCDDGDQFLVFQLSETFGGYWGVLPQSVYRHPFPQQTTYYTMSVSSTTPTVDDEDETNSTESEVTIAKDSMTTPQVEQTKETQETQATQATVVVEVPLVNISNVLMPAEKPIRIDHHLDRNFDKYYDVTPRVGLSYATQIVPLLEVSPMEKAKAPDKVRGQSSSYKVKYSADYFGLRPTLTSWRLTTRINNFRNKFYPKILARNTFFPLIKRSTNDWLNTMFLTSLSTMHSKEKVYNEWNRLDLLINNTGPNQKRTNKSSEMLTMFVNHNPSSKQNKSMIWNSRRDGFHILQKHLSSKAKDFSAYTIFPSRRHYSVTEMAFDDFLKNLNDLESKTVTAKNGIDKTEVTPKEKQDKYEDHSDVKDNNGRNLFNQELLISSPTQRNYVISPPKDFTVTYNMNTLSVNEPSNKHITTSKQYTRHKKKINTITPIIEKINIKMKMENNYNGSNKQTKVTFQKGRKRKRYIEAIQIENAIPMTQATTSNNVTVTDYMKSNEIVQNLADLIELSADEINERVAQGNINKYMSDAAVFNICEHKDIAQRHVILLNTSRLFLLITNFNLQGMTLVLTNAKTMDNIQGGCLETQLECQVSGHRVCIDSSCECDGIPNCGSYDIYDEDRLRCYSKYITNNMHLAVIAFVVLIFTLMYAVYFWLQRCVSDVSEAFFVYIAGTDNMLNINSIMKSPNDTDEAARMAGPPCYFEDLTELNINRRVKTVRNMCTRFLLFLICRKSRTASEYNDGHDMHTRHLYSFTQLELSKILSKETADAGIQTGESLEMGMINSKSNDTKDHKEVETETSTRYRDSQELKLLKISRSESLINKSDVQNAGQSDKLINIIKRTEEKEIAQVDFYKGGSEISKYQVQEDQNPSHNTRISTDMPIKKIRFEEHSRTSEAGKSSNRRQRTSLEMNEKRSEHAQPTTSKDQRWFWSKDTNKSKKSKK